MISGLSLHPLIALNGRSYAQCRIAWLRQYQPRQTLAAGTELAKPLKPALRMSCCYQQAFYNSYFDFNNETSRPIDLFSIVERILFSVSGVQYIFNFSLALVIAV